VYIRKWKFTFALPENNPNSGKAITLLCTEAPFGTLVNT